VKSEAAVAIQAAVRGRAARKAILTQSPQQQLDENNLSPSKELQMIQDARKQITLGTTAEQMVHRRKTMEPGVIPPRQNNNDDDMSVASYNTFASEVASPAPKNKRRGNNEDNLPPLTKAPTARNGRSSVLLQRRLSHLLEEDGGSIRSLMSSNGSISNGVGEHFDIGRELLGAHKKHMDSLMEILKLEMDAMRVSEKLLKQTILTEEDLVRYCESVELCLERRTDLTSDLKKKLHQLCEGGMGVTPTNEPPSSPQSFPTNGHANQ
jgi:hypothetical protein